VLKGTCENWAVANLLRNIDSAVLAATAWGGTDVFDTNVYKTGQLLKLLDPVCQQVIYFPPLAFWIATTSY